MPRVNWSLELTLAFINLLITAGGIAVCYFLVSRLRRIRAKILVSFLLFGFLIGGWSSLIGKKDINVAINPAGSMVSEIIYNDYLLPYWRSTLEPIGYEETPIIRLSPVAPPEAPGPGEEVGVERVPIYDFPLKQVSDLYLPVSLLFWGLVGLAIQLIYVFRSRR